MKFKLKSTAHSKLEDYSEGLSEPHKVVKVSKKKRKVNNFKNNDKRRHTVRQRKSKIRKFNHKRKVLNEDNDDSFDDSNDKTPKGNKQKYTISVNNISNSMP